MTRVWAYLVQVNEWMRRYQRASLHRMTHVVSAAR